MRDDKSQNPSPSAADSRNVPSSDPPKKKFSFWKRLGDAVVMQAAIEAQKAQGQQQNGVNRNPDGSWSYRNDVSGNSIISDGNRIMFTDFNDDRS